MKSVEKKEDTLRRSQFAVLLIKREIDIGLKSNKVTRWHRPRSNNVRIEHNFGAKSNGKI